MFLLYLLITYVIHADAYEKNSIRAVKDYILDTGLQKEPTERRIFDFKKNGIKVDVKIVSSDSNDLVKNKDDDNFPEFPVKDIGKCIIDLSFVCVKKRFIQFLETIRRLDEITVFGQDVKLVKNKLAYSNGRSMTNNNNSYSVESSVDDFFDSFTLRITLPRWNKREKNQIDIMMDKALVEEGRKKGGGGGGKGGKGKMMMMGMLMMVKLKLIGLAAFKAIALSKMSLLLSAMMMMGKFGKGGGGHGGPWQSSGGGHGGGQYKEVVLLTKSTGGGGGGCCGSSDSYGAPPPSSYGPSSGGGGYGGGGHGGGGHSGGGGGYGGGGWGRSFDKRPMTLSYDEVVTTEETNRIPMIGEVITNGQNIDYPDYPDYQESIMNSSSTAWNTTNPRYRGTNNSTDVTKNNSVLTTTGGRSYIFNGKPATGLTQQKINSIVNTNKPAYDTDGKHSVYMDEWQAIIERKKS